MGRRQVALSVLCLALLSVSAFAFISFVPVKVVSAASGTTIKLSGHPQGAALDYVNRDLYIANNRGYVLVIDPSTGTLVKNITAPGYLAYDVYENSTGRVYVTNYGVGLTVIDPTTNTVVANISIPNYYGFGITAGNGKVFVIGTSSGVGMLKVLDPQTEKFVANVTLSGSSVLGAYDPQNHRLYVANYYGNTTSVVDTDTNTLVDTIAVPNLPFGVGYAAGKVYVTEYGSNLTAVIDPATDKITGTIPVGNAPDGFAYSGDPLIAISAFGQNGLGTTTFIDPFTDEPIAVLNTPNGPQLIIYDHYLGEFFVVQFDGFLTAYLQSQIQPTTSTSTSTSSTPTSSTTSTSSSSSQSTSSTSSQSSSVSTGGTGGTTGSILDYLTNPDFLVPLLFIALIILLWLIGHFPWGKTPPPEGGEEGTGEGTGEGTEDGTEGGGGDGTHEGTEGTEGTKGTGTEKPPPPPPATCGPDVSVQLGGILQTVIDDWNNLSTWGKIKQAAGMGLWNIDPLRDNIKAITPAGCGCPPSSRCDATVMCWFKCVPAGILNYTIWGVIECLVPGGRLVGPVLHGLYWMGKETVGNVTGLAPTSLHVGVYESYMTSVGREFYNRGVDGAIVQMSKIPGEPCVPCPQPAKRYTWKYTWMPEFSDARSKH